MNITKKVTDELKMIPNHPEPQGQLRAIYYQKRLHSLGKKADIRKSAKQVMDECISELAKTYPQYTFEYDSSLSDIVDEEKRQMKPDYISILKVCFMIHQENETSELKPQFAGEWVKARCEKLDLPFYQQWLTKLAGLGFLEKRELTRGGGKRYYQIKDKKKVEEAIAKGLI